MYDAFADSFAADRGGTQWTDWDYFAPYVADLPDRPAIADVGCGNGRLLSYLLKNVPGEFSYLAVDPALPFKKFIDERIAALPEGYQGSFANQSWETLSLPSASLDCAFAIASWHHVLTAEGLEKAAANLHAALKPGGLAFLTVWNLRQPELVEKYNLAAQAGPVYDVPWKGKPGETHMRQYYSWTETALVDFFSSHGFETLESFDGKNIVVIARKK